MATVTVNVDLTSTMLAQIGPTAKAWAVYFDASGANPTWYELTAATTSLPFNPPAALDVGLKIYFILQSMSPGVTPVHNPSSPGTDPIQTESDIIPAGAAFSAEALNYRYDSFEVTFTPNPADAGNLTDINGFGIPMAVEVVYSGTTPTTSASRGYNLSGGTVGGAGIWHDLANAGGGAGSIQNYAPGGGFSGPRFGISPAAAIGNQMAGTNYTSANWNPYMTSLAGGGATSSGDSNQIQLAGFYNGSTDVNQIYHNGGFYAYNVTYDGTNFKLTPGPTSQIQGNITISPGDLSNSIYMTLGNASIDGLANGNGTANDATLTMNTGANNEWGAVLRDFVAAFAAGYWNGTATSLNPAVLGSIVLNKEWNQDPTYAFGGAVSSGPGQVTHSGTVVYDEYAKVFFNETNSYGNGYSDFLTRAYNVGPLINVSDGSTAEPYSDASEITVTLFADSEAPTGYTPQVINNYLPAGSGGYLVPSGVSSSGIITELDFNVGQMSLKDGTPVKLVLKGAAQDVVVGTISSFGNYSVSSGGGGYVISNTGGTVDTGIIKIMNVPVTPATSSSTVNWYQIEVGSGAAQKIFNLYETVDTSGRILNPAYLGQASALAIDGLATVMGNGTGQFIADTTGQVGINFGAGGVDTLDPSLLETVSGTLLPTAPLVGLRPGYTSGGGGPFLESYQVWNAQTLPGSGHPLPTTTPQTVYNGGLVFGWNGADSAALQQQAGLVVPNYYVNAYTNKIFGSDVAKLTFTSVSGATLPSEIVSNGGYLTATADADGNWATTTPVQFGNGTYTVQMREFLASDSTFANPLNSASVVQSFTVSQGAIISSGGSAGSSLTVTSGQISAGLTVGIGGTVIVSGGTTSATMVSAGGVMSMAVGGGDIGSIVLGTHYVSSGAAASNTTVASGGNDYVYGTTSGASVNGGGTQVVGVTANQAIASGTTLNSGGYQFVKSQGSAMNTVVLGGGIQVADLGGVITNTTLNAGGLLQVSSGGIASGGAMSGGNIYVFSGGQTVGAQFTGSGGMEHVSSGGIASATMLQSGNQLHVRAGGSATGTTVQNGASLYAYAGGSSLAATVQTGGIEDVGGAGAIASGATVQSAGYEYVHHGASAVGANLQTSGHQWVWGSATTATSTMVGGGAHQDIYFGATAIVTTITASGGYQHVYSGGSASATTILSGGWQLVWNSGTTAVDTNVSSGGQMYVFSSGLATGATVFTGGMEVVYLNGITSGATVSGGIENVGAGGTASGTVVNSGGLQYNFGAAIGTTISAGGVGYAFSGGIMTSAQVSGGANLHIVTSGVASGTMINSGGVEYVWAGGTASGSTVGSGGLQVLLQTGSLAKGTMISAGGSSYVSSGGVASGTVVSSGGYLNVFDGGVENGAIVNAGGFDFIWSGGTVQNATLNGGFLEILSGGGANGGTIGFTSLGGIVKLDDSVHLGVGSVRISGLTPAAGAIDFADIVYTSGVTSAAWAQGTGSGTLTLLTSGALQASVVLFGNYVASSFKLASDGTAGTMVTDPTVGNDSQNLLTQPHG